MTLKNYALSHQKIGQKNAPADSLKFFEAARTTAKKASSLEPKNPEFLYAVYETQVKSGYVLEEQGDKARALKAYEAAVAVIEEAITLKPDEITYTASKEHALARIEGVRNEIALVVSITITPSHTDHAQALKS